MRASRTRDARLHHHFTSTRFVRRSYFVESANVMHGKKQQRSHDASSAHRSRKSHVDVTTRSYRSRVSLACAPRERAAKSSSNGQLTATVHAQRTDSDEGLVHLQSSINEGDAYMKSVLKKSLAVALVLGSGLGAAEVMADVAVPSSG